MVANARAVEQKGGTFEEWKREKKKNQGGGASSLQEIFVKFASFGAGGQVTEMNNNMFAKFARESKLLDKKLTATDVDLAFTKVLVKGQRKIGYSQFEQACGLLAEKKFPGDSEGMDKLLDKVLGAGGPASSGTKADTSGIYGKMTDTTQYTGAHKERFDESGQGRGLDGRDSIAKGGGTLPGVSGGGKVNDLSNITRSEMHGGGDGAGDAPKPAKTPPKATKQAPPRRLDGPATENDLSAVFVNFCSGAGGTGREMDGRQLAKLAKDCGILDKKLTPTNIDLIFAKVKGKTERKITFSQFKEAVVQMAAIKYNGGKEAEGFTQQLMDAIVAAGGPKFTGTEADASGIYDKLTDASQYTGSHEHRFDADGKGKGLDGRDRISKGGGHIPGGGTDDLSQITRTNLN